jgi:chaperonin GroES
LGDRVLLRPEAAEATQGGIILPETAQKKPQFATVVAVGPGKLSKDGAFLTPDLAEGDRVVFAKYGGTEVTVDGEELLIMDCGLIYGKVAAEA